MGVKNVETEQVGKPLEGPVEQDLLFALPLATYTVNRHRDA